MCPKTIGAQSRAQVIRCTSSRQGRDFQLNGPDEAQMLLRPHAFSFAHLAAQFRFVPSVFSKFTVTLSPSKVNDQVWISPRPRIRRSITNVRSLIQRPLAALIP